MKQQSLVELEKHLVRTTRNFPYPPTPPLAESVLRRNQAGASKLRIHRRLAWMGACVAALLVVFLAAPQLRAGVWDVLELGAVRIYLGKPTPHAQRPQSTPLATPDFAATPPTATSIPAIAEEVSPTVQVEDASRLDLAGETDLETIRQMGHLPLRLPTYPSHLGRPDRVFAQPMLTQPNAGHMAILVWLDRHASSAQEQVEISLYILDAVELEVTKMQPALQETAVHGQRALWTTGPYWLQLDNGEYTTRRLIDGHVLIWVEDEITYRLETRLPLAEAVRVAESLRPIEEPTPVTVTPVSTLPDALESPVPTPAPLTQEAIADCPISQPPNVTLPLSSYMRHYISSARGYQNTEGTLLTNLPPEGKMIVAPTEALGNKWPWYRRGVSGQLIVDGRRLDSLAPPVQGHYGEGYGDTGFQAGGISFPSEGCWEITGRVGNAELMFVTQVAKVPFVHARLTRGLPNGLVYQGMDISALPQAIRLVYGFPTRDEGKLLIETAQEVQPELTALSSAKAEDKAAVQHIRVNGEPGLCIWGVWADDGQEAWNAEADAGMLVWAADGLHFRLQHTGLELTCWKLLNIITASGLLP